MRSVRTLFVAMLFSLACEAQQPLPISVPTLHLPEPSTLQHFGPYNARILAGGRGLTKSLPAKDPILNGAAPWTLSAWVEFAPVSASSVLIAGAGDPTSTSYHFFALTGGRPAFQWGKAESLVSAAPFDSKGWHFFAASSDGTTVHFYVDGVEAGQQDLPTEAIAAQLVMAPVEATCAKLPCPHFGGRIAQFIAGARCFFGYRDCNVGAGETRSRVDRV